MYAEPGTICSVTIGVKNQEPPVFANANLAGDTVDILRAHATRTNVPIYAYCVMPDHVHLLLGPSSVCDVVTFVGQFKSLVQRAAWQRGVRGCLWQKSFWDHFVRYDEGLREAVAYVLANPVRRQLVGQEQDYPFAGSLVFGENE